ncbi:MAG: hypothetical protein B7733_12985 [Myxococcales bacterium FL481]|nr:MAG: hypothetical protein B7733_12985 [Myxococcales bacterium FL481]
MTISTMNLEDQERWRPVYERLFMGEAHVHPPTDDQLKAWGLRFAALKYMRACKAGTNTICNAMDEPDESFIRMFENFHEDIGESMRGRYG